MATGWGAYFTSYVKKKEGAPGSGLSSGAMEPSPAPIIIPQKLTSTAPTKKLYGIPAVPGANDREQSQLQTSASNSTSNASRVAKMFGYAAAAQAKIDKEAANTRENENADQQRLSLAAKLNSPVQVTSPSTRNPDSISNPAPKAVWTKIEPTPLVATMLAKATSVSETAATPPEKSSGQQTKKSSLSELDDLMNMLQTSPTEIQQSVKPESGPREWKKGPRRGKASISQLDDLMSSMMQTSPASVEKAKVSKKGKPSISELDSLMDMLGTDFSSSTDVSASRKNSTLGRGIAKSPMGEVKPWLESSLVNEPAPIKMPMMVSTEPMGSIQASTLSSPVAPSDEEQYTGPTISEYQKMSDQIKTQQEQIELERRRMWEEEERFEIEEKKLAEEDEMMKQFVAEVEREQARIKEEEGERGQEGERQSDYESDYGDSDADERDSFDRLDDDRLARQEANYQNSQVRIYEEEVEAERLRYDAEEEDARFEAQRIEDETFAKEQRRSEEESVKSMRYEESRLEEERAQEERRAWQQRREAKEREQLWADEENARLEAERIEDARIAEIERDERLRYEEDMRLEAARIEEERLAEVERAEQLRYEEDMRVQAQRMEEERITEEQERRTEEEREERLRYEEVARMEAQRIAEERMAQQQRVEREIAAQVAVDEEDFDDDEPLSKEAQLKKAEEKIKAAFAGLAQERGQLAGNAAPNIAIAVPKQNTAVVGSGAKPFVNKLKVGKVGVGLGLDVAGAQRGVSRYNTVGGRGNGSGAGPQVPEKSPGVARYNTIGAGSQTPQKSPGISRINTVAGRPGLPSGPRSGLPSGPRPKR